MWKIPHSLIYFLPPKVRYCNKVDLIRLKLKVHGPDFKSLYKEIDRRILPKDYGGDGLSLADLTGNCNLIKWHLANKCTNLYLFEKYS